MNELVAPSAISMGLYGCRPSVVIACGIHAALSEWVAFYEDETYQALPRKPSNRCICPATAMVTATSIILGIRHVRLPAYAQAPILRMPSDLVRQPGKAPMSRLTNRRCNVS